MPSLLQVEVPCVECRAWELPEEVRLGLLANFASFQFFVSFAGHARACREVA